MVQASEHVGPFDELDCAGVHFAYSPFDLGVPRLFDAVIRGAIEAR